MKFNMYNKKQQRVFVIILAIILTLAMVVPMVMQHVIRQFTTILISIFRLFTSVILVLYFKFRKAK